MAHQLDTGPFRLYHEDCSCFANVAPCLCPLFCLSFRVCVCVFFLRLVRILCCSISWTYHRRAGRRSKQQPRPLRPERCLFVFLRSSLSLPSFFFAFRTVPYGIFTSSPYVGLSAGRIIGGLIVTANSNLVPSGLGLRPERCLFLVIFFLSFLFVYCFALLGT